MLGRTDDDRRMFDRYKGKAQDIALKNGVPAMKTSVEFVPMPASFVSREHGLIDAFVYLANNTGNGSAVLVMGAAGKGDEDKRGRRPDGQPPMGSLAKASLARVKVPVALVKAGPMIDTDSRIKRVGRDKTPGLNFMVCLDGSRVARSAFDQALKLIRPGDSLYGYHVRTQASSKSGEIESEFGAALDKFGAAGRYGAMAMIGEERTRSNVAAQIEEFIDRKAVDVVVMGSVELSNTTKGHHLGSVAMALTKATPAHVVVVKQFAHT